MKKTIHFFLLLLFSILNHASAQSGALKLVFIRHGEKLDDGDNLSCKGFNRSLQLPAVLMKKFGRPANIYIPAVSSGEETKHVRMLQTISPFVINTSCL